MKVVIQILFTLLAVSHLNAQKCFQVSIQKNKTEDKNSKFYFTSVIDGRNDSGKVVGHVYTGNLNIPQCAAFKNSVGSTVLDFLKKTYTNKSAPAYLVKINHLDVSEKIHKNQPDTGMVTISLEFYKYVNPTELLFITSSSKTVFDVYEDATYSHDNRIKRALMASVSELASALNSDSSLQHSYVGVKTIQSVRNNKSDSVVPARLKDPKENYKLSLQLQGNLGWYTKGFGIRAGALFFLKQYPRVALGPSLFWNYFTLTNNLKLPSSVTAINYRMGNVGLNSFTRLNRFLGITIDGFVLFGTETVTYTDYYYYYYQTSTGSWQVDFFQDSRTTRDFIGGFNFEQGIQFMRAEKRGVNAKLSIYETVLTGQYYEIDYGIKLSMGINF